MDLLLQTLIASLLFLCAKIPFYLKLLALKKMKVCKNDRL